MATIVVEDGTGLANSNSYASEAQLATYAADRNVTVTGTAAVLLITAMDYIEQQPFKGNKNTKEQALQWPRFSVWIDSYSIDSDEIPLLLLEAQMEAALAVDIGNNPSGTVDRATKREKLDTLEVEYMDGARDQEFNRALETKLRKLLRVGTGGISAVTIRA
jgi:hypothetical protein